MKFQSALVLVLSSAPRGANAWEEVDLIASEALMHMEDALVLSNLTAKDVEGEFNSKPNGYAIGDTIRMRTNPEYQANEFTSTITNQDIRSSTRSMTIEKHYDTSVSVTAKEKKLDLESFSSQVIRPAAYALAEKVETYLASKFINAHGLYASSALFGSRADMAAARKEATLQQLSSTGRFCVVNLDLESTLLGADYFTTYNNRGEDGSKVFRDATMGHAMGMDFFAARHFPDTTTHLAGTSSGGAITNHPAGDNSLIGSTTLPYDGATTPNFDAGDRIKVAGMKRPMKLAADQNAGSGNLTLVDPITEVVPDNAAITIIGENQGTITFQGAMFDDRSMALAMPLLDPADDKPSFVVSNNGISLRVVQGYDMSTKKTTLSIDCLAGAEAWDPRRITLLGDY